MVKIAAVNAFLRGTGATFFAANLAAALAQSGQRVGLVDVDLSAPTVHYLLGIDPEQVTATLNDYLLEEASMAEATMDVSDRLASDSGGGLYVVPAADDIHRATTTLLSEYDLSQFSSGLQTLASHFDLDCIIVDTPAGTAKETLLTLALCDQLFALTTLDPREIKGTMITVDLARELSVTNLFALLNKSGVAHDLMRLQAQIREAYECERAAVLPYADDVAALASSGLFVCQFPEHPVTEALVDIATDTFT